MLLFKKPVRNIEGYEKHTRFYSVITSFGIFEALNYLSLKIYSHKMKTIISVILLLCSPVN